MPWMMGAAGLAIAFLGALATSARAADTVTVGAIYPLSGTAASAGNDARLAIETAADIVNAPHKGLGALPLGAGRGLTGLGGAKIAVSFADDLGNPSVAQSQALRLIGQERVAALIGGSQPAPTLAATAVAERRGVPFLVPASMAPSITGRGFTWVFRTTPLAGDVAKAYAQFLAELKQGGAKVDTVALVAESSEYGTSTAATLGGALKAAGLTIAGQVNYPPNATDLSPQVAQLHKMNPDAVIVIGHGADAILLAKTMKTIGYKPPALIGGDSGFTDPGFVAQVGNLAQGAIGRSAWSPGKPDSPAAIVNTLYKARSGRDLDDAGARVMQGFLVLADAIDRAGSTDPAAIQKALRGTDLKPEQLIVGYNGVKFDETGQNTLASTYLVQLQGKQYVSVWPTASAEGKLALPFKGWE